MIYDDIIQNDAVPSSRKLWAAVLEQALEDLDLNRAKPRNNETERDKRQAVLWLFNGRTDLDQPDPGSFAWVCGVLGLDPAGCRDKVRAWMDPERDRFLREKSVCA